MQACAATASCCFSFVHVCRPLAYYLAPLSGYCFELCPGGRSSLHSRLAFRFFLVPHYSGAPPHHFLLIVLLHSVALLHQRQVLRTR